MRDLFVTLDRDQPRLADQLAAALRESIGDGRLRAGTRLPSSREPPGLVLGYAGHPPDELAEAVRRLAALVRE